MKYTVEGQQFDTKASAREHAHTVSANQNRPIRVEWGDSTQPGDVVEYETVGAPTPHLEPEPVDRSERLLRRFERTPGTELPEVPRD